MTNNWLFIMMSIYFAALSIMISINLSDIEDKLEAIDLQLTNVSVEFGIIGDQLIDGDI